MPSRAQWALAALITLSGIFAGDLAFAQQAPAQSPFQPIEAPTLTPDMLKTPPAAPNADTGGATIDKSGKDQPALKLPNSVDLGKYELQFKAGRTRDITTRNGLDSGETSNLSSTLPAQQQDRQLPDYFGLKLSAPTR